MGSFGALDPGMAASEIATEDNSGSQDLGVVAQEALQDAALPNAPGADEPPLDSALLDKAAVEGLGPKQGQEAKEQPENKPPPKPQLSRAQQRIQELVTQRKQAEARAAELEAQVRAYSTRNAEIEQQRLEIERQRLEMETQRQRQLEEAQLSDVEKARRKFLSESAEDAKRALAPEIAELRAELEEHRKFRNDLMQRAEAQARFNKIDAMGKQVLNDDLLAEYTPEERALVGEDMEEMLHVYSAAFRVLPPQAAPKFKEFLTKLVKVENARNSRSAGARVAAGQNAPAPLPRGRPAAEAGVPLSSVSVAQLRRNGFENHIQWIRAGSPALTKK